MTLDRVTIVCDLAETPDGPNTHPADEPRQRGWMKPDAWPKSIEAPSPASTAVAPSRNPRAQPVEDPQQFVLAMSHSMVVSTS
jgi:hypothetical protein